MHIFTITLNPAFDIHYELESLHVGAEQYAHRRLREAGGKGINTSRALRAIELDNTAFVMLGEDDAASFEELLRADDVTYRALYVPGGIRENVTLHPADQPETRISLAGFSFTSQMLNEMEKEVLAAASEGDFVTFAGRIPYGLSEEEVVAFLQHLKAAGIRLIVDSNSFDVEELKRIRPWLIKPNEYEAAALYGAQVTPQECAQMLVQCGAAEQVLLSLGEAGAVFCDSEQALRITVPVVDQPFSTIGAGDSMLAGFLAAAVMGQTPAGCACTAAAWGTAACLTEGTRPPRPSDIARLMMQITMKKYA